ncbi:unnamed protein product [Vitrella brassicaformis CCMP3155]|uniref:Uncharacterized protein n=1 Tax=Vitrella brassicaformis (strain CCMP3155) TaxID=1169540 RepID=A0A0G4F7W1_VITBC|nr:unnamed protein product [Vitrella brassicaformis CCMP3155]|eukprot:CEM08084.1 unnamed protein product [Vitrella brassicaformis CCMP3155]
MARRRHSHEELWIEVAIRKLKRDARRHKHRKPRLKPNAHSAFEGFNSYMEVFGYLLHFSARNHETNKHVAILLQCVIPRCQLIRATGRQPRIVDGRVNLYQEAGSWHIEMESGAPPHP